jgi:nucleolin
VEQASEALQTTRAEQWCIQDRDIRVDFAPPRVRADPEPRHVLYISDFVGDEHDLRTALKEYESSIININLCPFFFPTSLAIINSFFSVKSPINGELQGVGFIEFLSIERASEVLNAMNGMEYAAGTKLRLRYAQPKTSRSAMRSVPGGNGRSDRVDERWQGRRSGYGQGSNRIYGRGGGDGGDDGGGGGRGGFRRGRRDDRGRGQDGGGYDDSRS